MVHRYIRKTSFGGISKSVCAPIEAQAKVPPAKKIENNPHSRNPPVGHNFADSPLYAPNQNNHQPHQRRALKTGSALIQRQEAPIQRKIEDDLEKLGISGLLPVLMKSPKAQELIDKVNAANISIVAGGWGGAHTAREKGSGRILVSIPKGDPIATAQALAFELHNALRQDRFDALTEQSKKGEIVDEDEFARKKIQVEIEGMVKTGQIASELRKAGVELPLGSFYTASFLKYAAYAKNNPFASLHGFAQEQADEVLDRPHAQGSHRKVYTEQFRANETTENRDARAQNDKQRKLVSQVRSMSKLLGAEAAAAKLWREETDRALVLFDYLTKQSSTNNNTLRADLLHGLASKLNDDLQSGKQEVEPFIVKNPALMKALYSWIEANDDGPYRNLVQILGLSLGYYDNHPEHLRFNIYK